MIANPKWRKELFILHRKLLPDRVEQIMTKYYMELHENEKKTQQVIKNTE